MPSKTINILEMDERDRKAYMQTWWDGFEKALVKRLKEKKNAKTSFTIKPDYPKESLIGIRKIVTLKNDKKELSFAIEIFPWMLKEGSIFQWIQLLESTNLSIPSKKVKPLKKGQIWNATYDSIDFLTKTAPVIQYMQAVELTPSDVGLFDNINAAIENFLGK